VPPCPLDPLRTLLCQANVLDHVIIILRHKNPLAKVK
jgi:hypothetical protein